MTKFSSIKIYNQGAFYSKYFAISIKDDRTAYIQAPKWRNGIIPVPSNAHSTIKHILPGYKKWESYMGRGDKMSTQDIKTLKAYYGCL